MPHVRAEYQRQLRGQALAEGRCSTCRKNHARPGLKTCEPCAARDGRTYVSKSLFRVCCQSFSEHRFDCREVDRDKRGPGPFGPVTPPTPAEIIAAMRTREVRVLHDRARPLEVLGVRQARVQPRESAAADPVHLPRSPYAVAEIDAYRAARAKEGA